MIRVILLIDCASGYDLKLLRGMMRYSEENRHWLIPPPRLIPVLVEIDKNEACCLLDHNLISRK